MPRSDSASVVVFVACVSFVVLVGWARLRSDGLNRDAREREDRLVTLFRFIQGADDGR